MDDSKIFMFPDGGTSKTSNDVNSLLPLLMCNGGFGGGNWIWIIFLFFLYPLMRNGGLFGNMGQNCGSCLGSLANMVNDNNGNLIIAESKQTIQSEVEATLQHANYVIEHIEDYKNQITKCEEVLKELNPQFAKDKARDERIAGIENEVAGMKGDIAKILAAVTKIKIMIIMVQRNMNKSELKEKIRRMKMEIQELEECLDKYEERDNRYDDDPQYRSRNPYDDEERYHEREEYGHRERGRYGRY